MMMCGGTEGPDDDDDGWRDPLMTCAGIVVGVCSVQLIVR